MELRKLEESSDGTITLTIVMNSEEFSEFEQTASLMDNAVADENDSDDEEVSDEISTHSLRLRRRRYCVTCSKILPGGRQVSWTERSYSGFLATIQGAGKCMRETGDPSNGVRRGSC